jgi:hypothetical protein
MKKPLLVANLLFAGLIGVALKQGTMTDGQTPVSVKSTAGTASQYSRREISSEDKIVADKDSSDSMILQARGISSNSGSSFLEESSCNAAKVEVTPCQ